MSRIFKLTLVSFDKNHKLQKSVLGELTSETISSFGDFMKLLEPTLYSLKAPEDPSFYSIHLDVCTVDPEFEKDGNQSISH